MNIKKQIAEQKAKEDQLQSEMAEIREAAYAKRQREQNKLVRRTREGDFEAITKRLERIK